MKKTITTLVAGALLSLGALANAAEPVQLTDNQMDTVSAGQSSGAITWGSAAIGVVASGANTESSVFYGHHVVVKETEASAATIAAGVYVKAGAAAGSHI